MKRAHFDLHRNPGHYAGKPNRGGARASEPSQAVQQAPAVFQPDRTIGVGAESASVVSYREERKYLFLVNLSANNIYISISQPAVVGKGIILPGGLNSFWEPPVVPVNEIFAIASVAGSALTIVEA